MVKQPGGAAAMSREAGVPRLGPVDARAMALLVAAGAVATVGAAWGVERAGYIPCELCLLEREPYYLAIPLALVTALLAHLRLRRAAAVGFVALALVFLAGAGLGAYHAGVEWGLWPGPTGCSGPLPSATSVTDFMAALKTQRPVRCDAPAMVVLGLSLAGWNGVVSLILAVLAAIGARRAGGR